MSKHYSERIKLTTLAELERNGGNIWRTAKETGISKSTIRSWRRSATQTEERQRQNELALLIEDETPIDDRLEQLARQMVAVMPEKVEEATLQELARALTIVLATMNQTRTEKEKGTDIRDKLARLMDRFANADATDGGAEGTGEA